MARFEADRDDLFAELASFVPRWEIQSTSSLDKPLRLLFGVRPNSRWTVYRDNGDYDQFTAGGSLRRAFRGRSTYLSTGITLARLEKHRTPAETVLRRSDLHSDELAEFLASLRINLNAYAQLLSVSQFEVLRAEPSGVQIDAWLPPLIAAALESGPALAPAVARS